MYERVKARVEIETLHELLPELDYYKLLLIEPTANQQDIDRAFREQTKALHPDRFFGLEEAEVKTKAQEIFRRINEAWRTLKDPNMRKVYDRDLRKGTVRMGTKRREQAQRHGNSGSITEAARTAQGRKYWLMALSDYKAKNYKGAVLNAELTLRHEPDNKAIAKWTMKVRKLAQAKA